MEVNKSYDKVIELATKKANTTSKSAEKLSVLEAAAKPQDPALDGGVALRGGSSPSDTVGQYDAVVGGGVRITRPAPLRTVV